MDDQFDAESTLRRIAATREEVLRVIEETRAPLQRTRAVLDECRRNRLQRRFNLIEYNRDTSQQ